MQVGLTQYILAIIALDSVKHQVAGGAPIFIVDNEEEQQRLALYLSRLLKAMAHDLENGMIIIVKQ
ncbi:capping complex subunit for YIEGIA [Calderihabitans maritimus]|uniref:Uncharacterized protein n=1 Tax=Calderihabitans maritimus TaxID=1246530 RepID=A0A1Z5HUM0_9FIRM|nr:hypothetical protein [Calderihabitans maritimus]GAW93233.1 hypothetical protein Teth39_0835 [Calderihabitans maritimus]